MDTTHCFRPRKGPRRHSGSTKRTTLTRVTWPIVEKIAITCFSVTLQSRFFMYTAKARIKLTHGHCDKKVDIRLHILQFALKRRRRFSLQWEKLLQLKSNWKDYACSKKRNSKNKNPNWFPLYEQNPAKIHHHMLLDHAAINTLHTWCTCADTHQDWSLA